MWGAPLGLRLWMTAWIDLKVGGQINNIRGVHFYTGQNYCMNKIIRALAAYTHAWYYMHSRYELINIQ